MIRVKIRNENGHYSAVSDGHAGWCAGNDIVCAAVSAIMFTLMGAIENLSMAGLRENGIADGHIDISCKPKSDEDRFVASVLFNAAIIGILQLQEEYPDYVRLEE